MKKVVSFICGLAILSIAGVSSAQELKIDGEVFKRWYVQGDVGFASPTNDTLDHENATVFGARLGNLINENVAIELQYRYTQYDLSNEDSFGSTPVTGSEIRSNMFLVNAKFGAMVFTTNEKFYPYASIGVGYAFNDWTGVASRNGIGSPATFTMDDSIIFQGALGIDYYASNDFVLNLELSNLWSEADSKVVETDGTTAAGDLDIGYTSITIGFRMMF